MESEPRIVFENMDSSDAVRSHILAEIARLEGIHGRITACRVVVDKPKKGRIKGGPFQIRIHLTLPGGHEVTVHPKPSSHKDSDELASEIRSAFAIAERQLKRTKTRMRGDVKTHEPRADEGDV